MIWLVTGSTGLIGRAVVTALKDAGHYVLALARSAESFWGVANDRIIPYNVDLTREGFSIKIPPTYEQAEIGIIALASHITASRDLSKINPNLNLDTLGHLRLIEVLKPRLKHIIYASSCTVYGSPKIFPVTEDMPLSPNNIYSLCKVASEKMLSVLEREWRIPVSIMRIAQVYGPGANINAAMYRFLGQIIRGKKPRFEVAPETFRDYCHVSDVVQALMASVLCRNPGIYNVGGGEAVSIQRLLDIGKAVSGKSVEPEIVSKRPDWNMWLDISRARNELGYNPQINIENGIKLEYSRLWESEFKA